MSLSQHDSMFVYDSLECVTYRLPTTEVVHVGQGPFFKVCEAFFANICCDSNCGYTHINVKLIERLKNHAHEFHESLCAMWKSIETHVLVHVPPLGEPIAVEKDNVAFTRGAVQAYLSCGPGNVCSDHLCTWCPVGQMCPNIHVNKTWLKKMLVAQRDLIMETANNALVTEYSNSMVPRFVNRPEPGALPAVMEVMMFPNLHLSAEVAWEVPAPCHPHFNVLNASPMPIFSPSSVPEMVLASNEDDGGDCKESNYNIQSQHEHRDEVSYRNYMYKYRIFASGKCIPDCTNEEIVTVLGEYGPRVIEIYRPDNGREFLYISMADEEAFNAILEWPRGSCTVAGHVLNFSKALPKEGNANFARSHSYGTEPTTHNSHSHDRSSYHGRSYSRYESHTSESPSFGRRSFPSSRFTHPNPNREESGSSWRRNRAGPQQWGQNDRFEDTIREIDQQSPNWSA